MRLLPARLAALIATMAVSLAVSGVAPAVAARPAAAVITFAIEDRYEVRGEHATATSTVSDANGTYKLYYPADLGARST